MNGHRSLQRAERELAPLLSQFQALLGGLGWPPYVTLEQVPGFFITTLTDE